jgi:acetylornithine deacetylase/succinyl-diaminopimelate desuccinylase-like protein
MNGVCSLASLSWPIVQSKYGISVCPNIFKLDEEKNEAYFIFDIRAMYRDNGHEETIKLLQNHFQNFIPEIRVETLNAINPVNVDPNHPLAQKVAQVARNHGVNIVDVGEKLGGASDTRYFTNVGIPGVELGMGGANAHGPNEWTSVSQLKRYPAIYREIFEELTK